jgi:SAM-dependent methyltransferase
MGRFYERYWAGNAVAPLRDFDMKWPVLAPMIPAKPDITILDYGCGNGYVLDQMRRLNPGARFFGVDVSEAALTAARDRLPDVTFYRVKDGGHVPLDGGAVDFIFCSEVVEHVYDTQVTFSEFARLLRPGGRILLTTPYHGLVKNVLLVLLAFDRHFDPTGPHVRFFTKRSLFACLRRVALVPRRHGYIGRFFPIAMAIYVIAEKA